MIWKERYKEILKTEREIKENLGNTFAIENNIIKKIDVVVVAHFGNSVGIDMICDCISPIPLYNSTANIGYILRALIDLFDANAEDGAYLKTLVGTPLRIVLKNNKAVAIGHFMKDEFFLIEDLMQLKK